MKILILFLLFTSLAFSQLIVDSTAVEKVSDSEDWFWGRISYEGTLPSLDDYVIGFLYGEDRDNISYAPAGWFNHNTTAKTILFRTEMGNLPENKIWVRGYILPVSKTSKYEIGGETYASGGKDWYYDIFQEPYLESDLPRTISGEVGSQVTFSITATGQDLQYEWFRRDIIIDTLWQYVYGLGGEIMDSLMIFDYSWKEPVKINGATETDYTTPNLQLAWDGWKVFCRIYNNLGEEYSRECLLRVQ